MVDGSSSQAMFPFMTAMQQESICSELPVLHMHSLELLSATIKSARRWTIILTRIVYMYLVKTCSWSFLMSSVSYNPLSSVWEDASCQLFCLSSNCPINNLVCLLDKWNLYLDQRSLLKKEEALGLSWYTCPKRVHFNLISSIIFGGLWIGHWTLNWS